MFGNTGPVRGGMRCDVGPSYDVLIVGAGQAGVQAAVSLRQGGFGGTVCLLSAEDHLPYERPPLSKAFLQGAAEPEEFLLRSSDALAKNSIDLRRGLAVESVDAESHSVMLEDGESIEYGRLIWAAGGRARTLSLPGADLDGVLSVRTLDDASKLRDRMGTAQNAVIIGGGYVGLETAAALRKHGIAVTVVEAQERLLARVTCAEISQFYADLHRAHGATVLLSSGVSQIIGDDGRVSAVELADGSIAPADVVIVGVGLIPNVEPLASAGARVSNGIDIDGEFRTSLPDVFAIGDCANYESTYAHDQRVRLESVPNAVEHGKAVAAVILGTERPKAAAPWFWSHQYDIKLQTVGLQGGHDQAVLRGSTKDSSFSVIYLRDGRVIALDCVNSVADFAQGKQLVAQGTRASSSALSDAAVPLKKHLQASTVG